MTVSEKDEEPSKWDTVAWDKLFHNSIDLEFPPPEGWMAYDSNVDKYYPKNHQFPSLSVQRGGFGGAGNGPEKDENEEHFITPPMAIIPSDNASTTSSSSSQQKSPAPTQQSPNDIDMSDTPIEKKKKKKKLSRFCFKWYNRFSERSPRLFAISFGFIVPLFCLVCLAALCGYPLAKFEAPYELDANDALLEQQMRFLVETAVYANVTQSLPRICLQLYLTNGTAEEFLSEVVGILQSAPTVTTNLTPNATAPPMPTNSTNGSAQNVTQNLFPGYDPNSDDDEEDILSGNTTNQTLPSSANNNASATANIPGIAFDDDSGEQDTFEDFYNEDIEPFDDLEATTGDGTTNDIVELGAFFNYLAFQSFLLQNVPDNQTVSVDFSHLSDFMIQCGDQMSPIVDELFATMSKTTSKAFDDPLTFAWSRCPSDPGYLRANDAFEPLSEYLKSMVIHLPFELNYKFKSARSDSEFQSQADYYRVHWEADRQRLYKYYMNQTLVVSSNVNASYLPEEARRYAAFERSISEATGREGCVPNVPASCWFWFTVMTTIGYGNTSPLSYEGRSMVYTLGFITLVLFGAASGRAGYVVTSLLEDFAIRTKLLFLNNPWVSCFIWGFLYYFGLLGIAFYYDAWQKERMGNGVGINTAYWFAYISSTTVGFGDYYLAAEALNWTDCVIYPIMFLLSFTLLASFLTKLADTLGSPFRDGPSLVEHFQKMDDIKSAEELQRHVEEAKQQAESEAKAKTTLADEIANPETPTGFARINDLYEKTGIGDQLQKYTAGFADQVNMQTADIGRQLKQTGIGGQLHRRTAEIEDQFARLNVLNRKAGIEDQFSKQSTDMEEQLQKQSADVGNEFYKQATDMGDQLNNQMSNIGSPRRGGIFRRYLHKQNPR